MKYKNEILQDNQFIRCHFHGPIKSKDIHEALNNFMITGYKALFDYRLARLDFCIREIDVIMEFLHVNHRHVKGKKLAILVNNPICTAILTLLKINLIEKSIMDSNIFYTEAAALEWLCGYEIELSK
jgi:hypothetical protein